MKGKPMENKIENLIDYVGDSAYDHICGAFDDFVDQNSFVLHKDYEPYGDTYVESCRFVSDEDDEEFREKVENEMTVDSVIEELKKDPHFRDAISDMIKYVVWNIDVEV